MNATNRFAGTARRLAGAACVGLIGALASSSALADTAPASSDDAPWVIDGGQYLPDPAYNNGLYGADAFAGSFSFSYRAKKLVHLDNGDVVAAALVPAATGGSPAMINLGLVRYDSTGHRVAWANPNPAYAIFGNQYIVYPNTADNTAADTVADIKDMQRVGNRIFVLIDHPFAGTADMDSRVIVFDTDGQLLASDAIVTTMAAEYGGGIVLGSNLQFPETITLAWAGTTVVSDGTQRPTFRRFVVNDDSTLTATIDPVYVTAGDLCSSLHDCVLNGIAAGGLPLNAPSRYYLVGARQFQGDDWDFLIFAVNPDGSGAASFSDDGARTYAFDAGDTDRDSAVAVEVTRGLSGDSVYVTGEVAQDCKPGIGVIKLGSDGAPVAGFGTGGEVVFGGSTIDEPTACGLNTSLGSARADYPLASAFDDNHLAIAGINVYRPGTFCLVGQPCPEDNVDGELGVLDATTGEVVSFRGYAFSDTPGGPRTRHSGLWGIVASGNGTFTAAGDVRYFQSAAGEPAGAMQVATIRFVGQGDTIFANGFDGG